MIAAHIPVALPPASLPYRYVPHSARAVMIAGIRCATRGVSPRILISSAQAQSMSVGWPIAISPLPVPEGTGCMPCVAIHLAER